MRPFALLLVLLLGVVPPADARLLLTREEAIRQVYGDSARVETRTLFLTEARRRAIERRARAPLAQARVTYQRVTRADTLAGLAFVDRHKVRTLYETVLVALDARGRVLAVEVLAWNEPDDYRPPARWLELFGERAEPETVRPGEALPRLAGATLTARAVTAAVRRALALGEAILADAPLGSSRKD